MMKAIFYACLCPLFLCLSNTGLWGQRLSIGVSSGPTIFTQHAEAEDRYYGEPAYKTRFSMRGDFMVHVEEHLGIKLEIAYEQKGFDRKNPSDVSDGADEYKFDYLSVPLLAELSFGQKYKIKAQAGASVEYLLHHTWVWELASDDRRAIDKTDEYERFHYSALAGIGAEFPLSKKISFELGGRCALGLKTLQKENSWVKFKHFGFVTFAGLRYTLGD